MTKNIAALARRPLNQTLLGVAMGAAVLIAGTLTANATVTNIDLSNFYNGTWAASEINGTAIGNALESGQGNAGTGATFSDPTGGFDAIGLNNSAPSQTIGSLSIALTGNSSVNGLFNLFWGLSGDDADITFANSAGSTVLYSLMGGDTIRDYNNFIYPNSLTGGSGGVTAQNWWSTQDSAGNGNGEPSQRLDMQTFLLPASWADTDLTSVTISNPQPTVEGTGGSFPVLSALRLDALPVSIGPVTGVPEPASFGLFGFGLALLGGLFGLRKRFA